MKQACKMCTSLEWASIIIFSVLELFDDKRTKVANAPDGSQQEINS